MNQYFQQQIDKGATEMFWYALERSQFELSIMRHKGTLDSFPTNVEFVRMASESMPVFKEVSL